MSLPSQGQSLSTNQISSTYLNWRLRYNYFRFCDFFVILFIYRSCAQVEPSRSKPEVEFQYGVKSPPYWNSTSGFDLDGSTWAQDREINSITKKSQKRYTSPILDITKTYWWCHGGWCPRRNHVCRVCLVRNLSLFISAFTLTFTLPFLFKIIDH